ncbi:MAG: hypothetical protein Q3963_00200 [Coriobacteriaceae bacterium]|nr:hypothetical protein [Coriobacteriaceae bacterium]
MKTCPICKARCFDDMEICYGCMHRFERGESAGGQEAPAVSAANEASVRQGFARDAETDARIGKHDGSRAGIADRHQAVKRGPSRVFGAVDGGDLDPFEGYADGSAWEDAPAPAEPPAQTTTLLEIATGPLASASIGNGYRLVVSLERE